MSLFTAGNKAFAKIYNHNFQTVKLQYWKLYRMNKEMEMKGNIKDTFKKKKNLSLFYRTQKLLRTATM